MVPPFKLVKVYLAKSIIYTINLDKL